MKYILNSDPFDAIIEDAAKQGFVESAEALQTEWENLSKDLIQFESLAEVACNIGSALDLLRKEGPTVEVISLLNVNHELADLLNVEDSVLMERAGQEGFWKYWYETDVSNTFIKAWDALVRFIRKIFTSIIDFFKKLFAKESAIVVEFDKRTLFAKRNKELFNPFSTCSRGWVDSKEVMEVLAIADNTLPDIIKVSDEIKKFYKDSTKSISDMIKSANGVDAFAEKCKALLSRTDNQFQKLGYTINIDPETSRLSVKKSGSVTIVEEPTSEDRLSVNWKHLDRGVDAGHANWTMDNYVRFLTKAGEFVRYSSRSIYNFNQDAAKLSADIDRLTKSMQSGGTELGEAGKEVIKNVRKLNVLLQSFIVFYGDVSNKFTAAFLTVSGDMDDKFFGNKPKGKGE